MTQAQAAAAVLAAYWLAREVLQTAPPLSPWVQGELLIQVRAVAVMVLIQALVRWSLP
jgi:hypothetical protein